MKREILIGLIFFIIVILCITLCYASNISKNDIQNVRIVKDVELLKPQPTVDLKDISNVKLVAYEYFGAIHGYIVFTDKEGYVCSVETRTWHGELKMSHPALKTYEREEELHPSKFRWIETKSGDELWVYPLEPIPLDNEKIKSNNIRSVTVYFELTVGANIKEQVEVYLEE